MKMGERCITRRIAFPGPARVSIVL